MHRDIGSGHRRRSLGNTATSWVSSLLAQGVTHAIALRSLDFSREIEG